MVGGRPPEVSVGAAETGEELLSPLTESRLSAIQLEQSIQSSRPGTAAPSPRSAGSPGAPTPRAVVGARLPGSGAGTPNETEEERELREAFELDEMLVCGVGLGELLRWQPELTRTPRRLRRVRTGYTYQPHLALCTYRRRRAACPEGPTYWAPATGYHGTPGGSRRRRWSGAGS